MPQHGRKNERYPRCSRQDEVGKLEDPEITKKLRKEGIVKLPEDLGVNPAEATRDLLAAKNMKDLVDWSGGLYDPPAKFRNW